MLARNKSARQRAMFDPLRKDPRLQKLAHSDGK
jgi:hypothetical protein